ncbi:putative membrane-anchored protein [Williamsia serinedens]|uniref:Membrane-anchored protein n=2 Tax=Williamsia serinedens TaxID=391736 RepID=A0ABT1H022_9NOCA|nr:putative membrane-anchored protein [Williamsia serinedens]
MRVPEVTALFWAIKILTTGMGETLSDFLGTHLPPEIAGGIILLAFVAAFAVLFRSRSFRAWKYWLAVSMVSVFGTVVADVIHTIVGVPYVVSSAVFAVAVVVILGLWHRSTGSLDVHDITDRRSELLYWATVCATFALGTALGDWTAASLGLGYLASAILFGVAIVLPLLAWRFGLNPVATFWVAYVLTRPLGASTADWLADAKHGGLGWGTGPVTLGWVVAIAALTVVATRQDTSARS